MPTYDYICDACEHAFEEFQAITAKPLKKCPECGRPKLKRLIGTGAGIIFKGSGFYQTDYRSDSYKESAKKDTESSKSSTATATETKSSDSSTATAATKTESKPAAPAKKAESKPKATAKA